MTPAALTSVEVGTLDLDRFRTVFEAAQFEQLRRGIDRAREVFPGRRVWNVSSTARGGGVAEMLTTLLAYARGVEVDARWSVIGGDEAFFAITKRIHNRLHGSAGDGGELSDSEREHYERTLAPSGEALAAMLGPRDVVILHDPQTAGLAPAVRAQGVPVVWRCHVGVDRPNELVRATWRFLEPYVQVADATVFSRRQFVWAGVDPARVAIVTPSIDAFAPKNQDLAEPVVTAILDAAGIRPGGRSVAPAFTRLDGTAGLVGRRAGLVEERPLREGEQYIAQVSRWDALKDPAGVVRSFVEHVAPHCEVHLVYAGPQVDRVADDPEGARVLDSVSRQWRELPQTLRERIHLAVLPMSDTEENAAIVNALQRAATVVVQKSLAEGFGLTVAEAMWKARPVVASRIGGIQEQIEDGRSGLLLDDPTALDACGSAVLRLLDDPAALDAFGSAVLRLLDDSVGAAAMGVAARARVRERFLGPRSLLDYLALLAALLGAPAQSG